ncbi:hypothetical protein [Streptosporangium vulgare]|uniref:hypothetical protein n=1 Tax=Streptosporangium vulgare TaxID=46190 RepID=UPI0031DCD39E
MLIENVRHHVEEEEQEWFPQVREAMGRKRLQELGEEMEKARPGAPKDPLALSSAPRLTPSEGHAAPAVAAGGERVRAPVPSRGRGPRSGSVPAGQ